ncbi:ribosomal-protein-alanine N-acetyltransferase [Streptoalloteichus hindustanus]|uniref:Ribosomal-protein-alanine N-acetyltransferase n=2 Tax=Streptoalloteichus hindustanus TaxID=2017 RepID=A0A1M5IYC4_STRHI|nr:ribosomal-protein-alanine N-acetyltransferase [Streptoalloteichus hindustanus]
MADADAELVAAWRYPDEHAFHDPGADADGRAALLDPDARGDAFWAVDSGSAGLVGYYSFARDHGDLEINLGLRPDLTGHGLGAAFLAAGLDFARDHFAPTRFVVWVATFDARAITVSERAGFRHGRVRTRAARGTEWEFLEMTRPA